MDLPSLVVGGGCFWCVESEFRAIHGVVYTRVGYCGGSLDHPSYRDVTTGESGHAEVVEIVYDPAEISFRELLLHFLEKAHDPTQLNRQGVDVGSQYRSVIFYQDDEQKMVAESVLNEVAEASLYKEPIVTELKPVERFWVAEEHHQQYYEKYEDANGRPHIRMMLKKNK